MKKLFLVAFLTFPAFLFSQIRYEPGYIVTDQGKRMDVLILNKDWKSTPTDFKYKTSETAEPMTGNIREIREFGIGNTTRFVQFSAPIDQSSRRLEQMTTNPDPEFVEKTVFLEQLVSGEVDLFMYREGSLTSFYSSSPDVPLTALISKDYREGKGVRTNNRFRQQLQENFSCDSGPAGDLRKVDYRRNELVKYFEALNTCSNSEYQVFEEEGENLDLNVVLKAGLEFSKISKFRGLYVSDEEKELGPSLLVSGNEIELEPVLNIGAEFEVVLPFNRNKWSMFAEAIYSEYTIDEKQVSGKRFFRYDEPVNLSVDFQLLKFTTGLKHYFFLTDASRLHLSAGLSFDVGLQTSVLLDWDEKYEIDPHLDKLQNEAYLKFGVGLSYKRLSIEMNYNTPKAIEGSKIEPPHYFIFDWNSTISSFSAVIGYRIF